MRPWGTVLSIYAERDDWVRIREKQKWVSGQCVREVTI